MSNIESTYRLVKWSLEQMRERFSDKYSAVEIEDAMAKVEELYKLWFEDEGDADMVYYNTGLAEVFFSGIVRLSAAEVPAAFADALPLAASTFKSRAVLNLNEFVSAMHDFVFKNIDE